jgi:hypothetical protein
VTKFNYTSLALTLSIALLWAPVVEAYSVCSMITTRDFGPMKGAEWFQSSCRIEDNITGPVVGLFFARKTETGADVEITTNEGVVQCDGTLKCGGYPIREDSQTGPYLDGYAGVTGYEITFYPMMISMACTCD